jgi:hypothetical protein
MTLVVGGCQQTIKYELISGNKAARQGFNILTSDAHEALENVKEILEKRGFKCVTFSHESGAYFIDVSWK